MKPYVALKIDPDARLTAAMIEAVRDRWIEEYETIILENPAVEDRCRQLICRAKRACELAVGRYSTDRKRSNSSGCYDDSYYEWVEQVTAAEEAELDGDFPLGNACDADFATPWFSIAQLARIQCGNCYSVPLGHLLEPSRAVQIRKGFLAELGMQWREAERWYRRAGEQERQALCCQRKTDEGNACLAQARRCREIGEQSRVPLLLIRAVNMENADAMVDRALACMDGSLYFPQNAQKALELLRQAAREYDSPRACMALVQLHDAGRPEISATEAKNWCEKAVKLDLGEAHARLQAGFDLRPTEEILKEQVAHGSIDAMWRLREHYLHTFSRDSSELWYQKALEAGQTDALLQEAEKCLWMYSDFYDRDKAEACLHRAAQQGSIPAMLKLGELALEPADEPFWQAEELADAALRQRHLQQLHWHEQAAQAGSAAAMNNLCMAYGRGYPAGQDGELAFQWAQRSAQAGDIAGIYHSACLLESGTGVRRDLNMALELYIRAAEAGNTDAMLRLYSIYKDGLEHIPADQEKAGRYLWMSGTGA